MDILEQRDEWLETYRTTWLAHYQKTGETDWKQYQRPKNSTAPAGPGVDLKTSRLILISSSGAYLPSTQQPFAAADDLGDYTIRVIPVRTPLEDLRYAHDRYDHTAVDQDPQVLMPLRHLNDLVAAGQLGEVAPSLISFMGYQPDATRVVDETIPEIVAAVQAEQAHAALLVPA